VSGVAQASNDVEGGAIRRTRWIHLALPLTTLVSRSSFFMVRIAEMDYSNCEIRVMR
jgi:hypothetical protein